uniref:Uncharacterized protein n=1 Tax=Utricularia reniformis TaxID=192314 RepID=A0A1Y0B1T5_9LAMI|nr:hypothetical protein AEK19_MT1132 [Utricularia reniformis]ART31348.1 hypothetical protein AEK19_MT1132 [Utricularia reniformis]
MCSLGASTSRSLSRQLTDSLTVLCCMPLPGIEGSPQKEKGELTRTLRDEARSYSAIRVRLVGTNSEKYFLLLLYYRKQICR